MADIVLDTIPPSDKFNDPRFTIAYKNLNILEWQTKL